MEVLKGVMFNAYPDSIGHHLSDTVAMLKRPEFAGAFSLFYVLPTFFNSDLDRGFSVIDYNMNGELVSGRDLRDLRSLGISLKFDLVLNHLSVGSPQFQDMLKCGDESYYKDFFIDWNEFWSGKGELGEEGYVIPDKECLDILFMRKPDLPILKVRFPDGTERPYWNTFYQEVTYQKLVLDDLQAIPELDVKQANEVLAITNNVISEGKATSDIDWGDLAQYGDQVAALVEGKRQYLGQMDLNAQSEKVWDFYDETLQKLSEYGATLIRLDAFAYLHKQPCKPNFFNRRGTWDYLGRLKENAGKYGLTLIPEIHAEYGYGLHEEVAAAEFPIYDFFFPGLLIDALDRSTNRYLLRWINEILAKNIQTINMLGCHDGIPVLDLQGKKLHGVLREGLLSDAEIGAVIQGIVDRGGRIKNLYGPDGKSISYYQVNATYFSALGEDERKLRLARAIQMFMPGVPQVWYLDLFAGKNDYAAADAGGTAGHKEINRTTLSNSDIERGLRRVVVQDQLQLIKFRNSSDAFYGQLEIADTDENLLEMTWTNGNSYATLKADLLNLSFTVTHGSDTREEVIMSYR